MFWSKRKPEDFSAEIRAHVELETARFMERGLSEPEARAAARRSFGNLTGAEERYYESGRWAWLDLLAQNARFGLRMLARNPGSSAVAILTLALGIGANTAIFSLLNAVLLRNLPVQHPNELALFGNGRTMGSGNALPNGSCDLFSYHAFREFQRNSQVFSDVAAIDSILFTTHGRVASGAQFEKIAVELVSGSYFRTLGVNPALGRTLTGSDDVTPGAHPVAVASYAWWQRRMGKAPSAVGTKVVIGSTSYSIIGVGPPEFSGAAVGQSPDLWIPLAMEREISPGWNGLEDDLFQSLYVIARRKPGVTLAQAQANTNVLFQQIVHRMAGGNPSAEQLSAIGRAHVVLTPAATGLSNVRHRFSSPLTILMAMVGLVLLIACANVANLLLARATARQREIAVRMSIGAGRARLIQQLLMESGMLGLAGAALSVPIAWGLLNLLVSAGTESLPIDVSPDAQVLGFALALTMLTVALFGMAPAFRATRVEPASSLKVRGATDGAGRNRLARGLIAGQVALSLALLAGAGLFLRSLDKLMHVDTGFDRRNVLCTGVDPAGAGYKDDARLVNMMQQVEQHVAAVPGIRSASFAFSVFDGGGWTDAATVPGRPHSDQDPDVTHNIVGAQYIDAMKMAMVAGRTLSQRDTAASQRVAVINETMARLYFPGVSPVGRTFSVGTDQPWQDIQVVGVVKDGKYMRLQEKQQAAAFYPYLQHRGFLYNLVTRYSGDPKVLIPAIRRAVAEVDPNLPTGDFSTLEKIVNGSVESRRLVALLSTLFGALAALLASIGIYGVMSYAISRRTNEFGIRMALGAQRPQVLWLVLRETLGLVLIGVAAGVALALTLSRLVTSMLFGLAPSDPLAIGLAAALMVAVAFVAGWLPARRATRIDPMVALRYE
jgi:predicted permease